ncbi:MAG: hypothetical protein ACYDA2_02415 [Acidimicrobiales bacterium]
MAEKGALVTTWGAPRSNVPIGKGMEVFGKALGWYDELAKEHRITGYRVYGCLTRERGMIVAEGDTTELAKIAVEPRTSSLLALAAAVTEDIKSELYVGGSPDDVVGFYTRAMDELTAAGLG